MSNLFCKCTCTTHLSGVSTTNSTIVELTAQASCADCTRAFCLAHRLPGCTNAKADEDVLTTCFQRDSNKDAAVVYIFIVLTVGLLAWALLAPTVTAWVRQARARQRYEPLPGGR